MKHGLIVILGLSVVACSGEVASIAPLATPDASDVADAATSDPTIGEPGCGFAHAAFCDTFDAPSAHRGRAGELDARIWSAGHVQPSGPTAPGFTFGILPATIPSCRADLPAQVFPGQDALICDPNGQVPSNHLLVACGAQNYGATSLRIRQPFDFEGHRPLTADELHAFSHNSQGALAQVLDVPLGELEAGDNTLEYVTVNVPQSYPPAALNIDLVLSLESVP